MFDFAQLAVGAEHRDEPILERPPVSGLRIPLGKLRSERSDWATQLPSGQVTHEISRDSRNGITDWRLLAARSVFARRPGALREWRASETAPGSRHSPMARPPHRRFPSTAPSTYQ